MFIEQAVSVHGDKYSYNAVDYKTTKVKVSIFCPEHGYFEQSPEKHLAGQGCKLCGKAKRQKTTDEVIAEFQSVHGNRYDYGQVQYKSGKHKVKICCYKHGIFEQRPDSHIKGMGCPMCRKASLLEESFKAFLHKAKERYSDYFDYSAVKYVDASSKVVISCPVHGKFEQTPSSHLKGNGCPSCGHEVRASKQRFSKATFITKAMKIHGDKYDYSKVMLNTVKSKVVINCPNHGEFEQIARKHLEGQGCPKCYIKSKIKPQEAVLKEFRNQHGELYDYTKVDYVRGKLPVTIVCKAHGEFEQTPELHILGSGCPTCATNRAAEKRRMKFKEFVEKARAVHGETYEYDNASYTSLQNKVKIKCLSHGWFEQAANGHLSGRGCPQCGFIRSARAQRKTQSEFLNEANSIHGSKYDYSKAVYRGDAANVIIGCPNHGEFTQRAGAHIAGAGCKKCADEVNADARRRSADEFVKKAKEIHGDFYLYNNIEYQQAHGYITVGCPIHGEFEITANSFLLGRGCNKCGRDRTANARRSSIDDFVLRARQIHGDAYGYESVEYITAKKKVTICCPIHGNFEQTPDNHLNGNGCPACGTYGFDTTKPAILYYLKVEIFNQVAYKIGITNRTVIQRFKGEMDKITILKEIHFQHGADALAEEQRLLKLYKEALYDGEALLSSGNSELFSRDVLKLDF